MTQKDHKVFVGCGIVILSPDGEKVLLAQRKKEPEIDGFQIPGGTVEYNTSENLLQASVREVLEETGFTIEKPTFLCTINSFYYGKERPIHFIFTAVSPTFEIPLNPEPEKAKDWQWFSLDDLPKEKWFRMSHLALEFYKKLRTNLLVDRFIVDGKI